MSPYHLHFLVAFGAFFLAFFLAIGFWPPSPPAERATDAFRKQAARCRTEIAQISALLGALPQVSEPEPVDVMAAALSLIRENLLARVRGEERFLFPAAERHHRQGIHAGIEVLRMQHRLMEEWADEMERLSAFPLADAERFSLRGERLLGLFEAHLAAEEEFLLPVLDRAMTPTQFRREVVVPMGME
jgi:iron-sulfur cluster repair protein YtfE (RIC family)